MESPVQTHNTLAAEIKCVREFLKNEEFRYNGKLSWECSLDPEVDTTVHIPSNLIHTFVENAIRYGIFQNPEGGKIDVSINKSSLGILIMISDNGIEIKDSLIIQNHCMERLKLLDSYLELFNRKHPCRVSYKILDRSEFETDRTGTRVLITLKY